MKITVYLTKDVLQFNLEAETEAEKMFVKTLSKHSPGTVEVHQGANLSENQAGYVRNFGGGSSICAVTIRKKEPESNLIPER